MTVTMWQRRFMGGLGKARIAAGGAYAYASAWARRSDLRNAVGRASVTLARH